MYVQRSPTVTEELTPDTSLTTHSNLSEDDLPSASEIESDRISLSLSKFLITEKHEGLGNKMTCQSPTETTLKQTMKEVGKKYFLSAAIIERGPHVGHYVDRKRTGAVFTTITIESCLVTLRYDVKKLFSLAEKIPSNTRTMSTQGQKKQEVEEGLRVAKTHPAHRPVLYL